ncbi:DUF4091 domain-containing protein [Neobacillus kokaensis]|uniref:Glycoside hydrolase 123 catalytic domain-containing protein n=1 Tax=Neobacillus kokaensis TaxID=2759023 RepID=A0ABQ3N2V8_9BACI|nr:DUF4091 domain-containing protein [Neobacillus kokaensis]GHH97848.1 hypothetical protein AM1BK_13910 [Neobacillus kokaensis]
MTVSKVFTTRSLSSLTKVFPDVELMEKPINTGSALLNETYSFQVAYKGCQLMKQIVVKVYSDIKEKVTVRTVGLVPSELPCYHDHDDIILRSTPGLYPDPLYPIADKEGIVAFPGQWRSIWVTVNVDEDTVPGIHDIKIEFQTNNGEVLGEEIFQLEVIPAKLPEQTLIHTQWFHTDCIATLYDVEVFSEAHWERIDQFVKTAVDHGINMILTPLFTPPLDTEIGGERPTVQLVGVEKLGQHYKFNFDKLERWIELCRTHGIQYFEFSHLFTQWGAKHAPKIMGYEQGEYKRLFGWETDAAGAEYQEFLGQFLPELVAFIQSHHLEKQSYFHISDEPSLGDLDSYQKASETIQQYLKEFPIIDALSDYPFYEKGYVKNPIPANNHIEPFLENGVDNLWTYYCCAQYKKVSNRFFSMPSFRNRVLGMQLYKFNIAGFLHWGYNFWYAQYSKKPIDPFKNTDADYAFASGDAFLVYPGESGPIESIRLEVLYEGLQDLRALRLLEEYAGKERVIELLEENLEEKITFSEYPLDLEWYLQKRRQVNSEIKKWVCSKV